MKIKRIFIIACSLFILTGVISAICITTTDIQKTISNLTMRNMEIMAQGESPTGGSSVIILKEGEMALIPNQANRILRNGCYAEDGSTCEIRNSEGDCNGSMIIEIIANIIVSILCSIL